MPSNKGTSMRSAIARVCGYGLGLALIVDGFVANVGAQSSQGAAPAPEIDGATVATGLALASGVVLILRSRRRTK
jgi:hypothetical protein